VPGISCFPFAWVRSVSALSPNRKRHIARVVIWSAAAAALLAELSFLAVGRLA